MADGDEDAVAVELGEFAGERVLELQRAHLVAPQVREHVDDLRHTDVRVPAVRVGEEPLVGGLRAVVELFADPRPQLGDERTRIETGEHRAQHAEEQVGVDEVGADRLVDAGILHLHCDAHAGTRRRAVHLADRRGRDRRRVPLREHALGIGAELGAHHLRAELRRHGRRVLL